MINNQWIILRRLIQGASLFLFCVLFFYVSCPYVGLLSQTPITESQAKPAQTSLRNGVAENFDNDQFFAELTEISDEPTSINGADNEAFDAELDEKSDIAYPVPVYEPPTYLNADSEQTPNFSEHYAVSMQKKSFVVPYLFLSFDPSAVLATTATFTFSSRGSIWLYTIGIIFLSFIFSRSFCGYICPMGVVIDISDWLLAQVPFVSHARKKVSGTFGKDVRNNYPRILKLQNLRFGILIVLFSAAIFGVLLTGYVSPIPILTRNIGVIFSPLQTAYFRGWGQVPTLGVVSWISIAIFAGILFAGILMPRFFCRVLCPSGAIFSLFNHYFGTLFSQKIDKEKCVKCAKCFSACAFD
ncbi:MAG: 4Fe-4S binding protein, partial [Thermoguttaceae bacterium]